MSTEKVPQPLGEEELVERSTPNKDLASAVVVAVVAVLKQHLAAGTDVNTKDERGGTAWHPIEDDQRFLVS